MDFIIDAIVEWLKGLLVDGIMGNLDGLFDNVNQSVGEIATQVGTTPADWNAGVFSMIRQISETAILPIAGVILTFVMTYELIQMLIERNNLHEVDTWMFFKWVFKTFVAVMILTNTFNIVLAVFDVSQHVIQQSAGIIQNGTEITPDVLDSLRTELEAMELGPLFGLWLQSFLIQLTMIALNIVIFVSHGGTMVANEVAAVLSPAAKKCGFKDKGYICYEEDAQESVVLRELLDKKLWNIPDRIKDKGQFEEKLNQSIRQYNPEYWRARQSGREAAEAARSTAPAKEAAR